MPNSQLSQVIASYTEPWRQYHGLDHPNKIIRLIKMLNRQDRIPKWAIDFAWYHDAVFLPGGINNEQQSADLFAGHVDAKKDDMGEWDFKYQGERHTYNAIIYTADHLNAPRNPVTDVCLDADLAVLGFNPEEYREYCFGVESEVIGYYHTIATGKKRMGLAEATKIYLTARQKFLEKVLAHIESGKLLFRTPQAINLWEEQAMLNLLSEHDFNAKRIKRIR